MSAPEPTHRWDHHVEGRAMPTLRDLVEMLKDVPPDAPVRITIEWWEKR